MQLELKHLIHYLDCGLLINYRILDLQNGDPTTSNNDDRMKDCVMKLDLNRLYTFLYDKDYFKPILYPLSYLTKEITHNGDTFVPYDRLEKIKKDIQIYEPLNPELSIELCIITENYSQQIDLMDGYLIMKQLIEWRFDIFRLIDNNIAIPVTEDFNPYK